MRDNQCLFCGVELDASQLNLPSSRTKEHVFAKWIRDATTNNRMSMYEGSAGSTAVLKRQLSLDQLTTLRVCRECNNGWMEELETRTDPLAQRLFAGEDIRDFTSPEIETLARWTAKTAAALSYTTPQQKHVPKSACRSLHPSSPGSPQFRFFYGSISGNINLEGGHFQLEYGNFQVPIVGEDQVTGTRILLCLNNQFFVADFPPFISGTSYDLSKSILAQLWPVRMSAGSRTPNISLPAPINEVLTVVAHSIEVGFDAGALHI